MEEPGFSTITDGEITGIQFSLASHREISTASVSGSAISHASQLSNPYLGLPLELGKCESCGTSEMDHCEGHFGYVELPIVIYHPSHIGELRRLLSLICLNCLKLKKGKVSSGNASISEQLLSCCAYASQVSIVEVKRDGYSYLQLKVSSKQVKVGYWNFLEPYGFRYGGAPGDELSRRTLLPSEVMEVLRKLPEETRKKLKGKGYFPQDGYLLQFLPVPPNCLAVPDVSDGVTVMSGDPSTAMLRKIIRQVEVIRSSRSVPNFESVEIEANDLQLAVAQYLEARGTVKQDLESRFGVKKEDRNSSRKIWFEKMRTLFIRKGSGFSSRSVITGDAYKAVNEVGIPQEIAQRITFEEKVTQYNMRYLQDLVDNKLCLAYKDGSTTFSLKDGSKGHAFLKIGQEVQRRIMDGDIVFINRPPTTHKHSLQALKVYIHDDHTVKINPLICAPLSADFDGDCIHLFYPQSPVAKAEVMELFALEKQILSSHSGNLIMQLASDSLLSLKIMMKKFYLDKVTAQQLVMFTSPALPEPAQSLPLSSDCFWTALQVLQTALPASLSCKSESFLIKDSQIMAFDFRRDGIASVINEIGTFICFEKGASEVLKFFNRLQPLLMENVFAHGFSVGLEDFSISEATLKDLHKDIQDISQFLYHLRSTYNELVVLQMENQIRLAKVPITRFIQNSSSMGSLIESKSGSSFDRIIQQIGFLGLQISDRGKFYSKTLVEDVASLYKEKYPKNVDYPSAEFGFIRSCFFHGLDPYEQMVHSISTREVIVRSSRGLSEPGTLFKNLMAILRDVVICYDGTVRNVCSNSIIQFKYGDNRTKSIYPAGEPVGVLAATAMSNPAYKAVLDSTPSSNSAWEFMKEILLCKASFKNELLDRRVILYLNYCGCGREYCAEKAAYYIENQLKKVSLKDTALEFLIEYRNYDSVVGEVEVNTGLVGHIHLDEVLLREKNISLEGILKKCEEAISSIPKKKKKDVSDLSKAVLTVCENCCFHKPGSEGKFGVPCLLISLRQDVNDTLELSSQYRDLSTQVLANSICPFLLQTIVKGDTRICSANITWTGPDSVTWIRNPQNAENGELAVDVVLEKSAVKKSGDAWRIVIDLCLPVLHLIDTRRSIPYGIKQVEELLGISAVFDQAVQRLSTSVSMVSKGVLREHLILLGNSMSCAGNFIGFNSGGYKALSKSLKIQVPFTEATLITPKKCFERAAEKCHVDSLSSIVASCSWGKHVAVGTGSKFDVLWDTRKVELNQAGGVDVHNFLAMVGPTGGDMSIPGSLGVDIDDIFPEDDTALCQSPENFGSDKPVFEDGNEFLNIPDGDLPEKSSWDNVASGWGNASSNGSGWGKAAAEEYNSRSNGWNATSENASSWEKKTDRTADQGNEASGWDNKVASKKAPSSTDDGWSKAANTSQAGDDTDRSIPWNASNDDGWVKGATSSQAVDHSDWSVSARNKDVDQGGGSTDWGKQAVPKNASDWNSSSQAVDQGGGSTDWGQKAAPKKSSDWNSSSQAVDQGDGSTDWGQKAAPKKVSDWNSSSQGVDQGEGSTDWGKKAAPKKATSDWNSSSQPTDRSDWSVSTRNEDRALFDQGKGSTDWDNKTAPKKALSDWNSQSANNSDWFIPARNENLDSFDHTDWSTPSGNKDKAWGKPKKASSEEGWVKEATSSQAVDHSDWSDRATVDQGKGSTDWDNKTASKKASFDWNSSSQPADRSDWSVSTRNEDKTSFDQGKESTDWDNKAAPKKASSEWNSSSQPVDQADSPWGKLIYGEKKGPLKNGQAESSGRWGADSSDWKPKKNRPNQFPGPNSDFASVRFLTETRKRLDIFTSEEQDALNLLEPIVKSIKGIMHKTGYNDGDPLEAEDQTFITENIFNFHPEKDAKMGPGIDHFMVNKHGTFQDSRCLYVVSTDGRKEDFSYRKCLENRVKINFPEIAEEFCGKYFKLPPPREPRPTSEQKSTQEQKPTPEQKSTLDPWAGEKVE